MTRKPFSKPIFYFLLMIVALLSTTFIYSAAVGREDGVSVMPHFENYTDPHNDDTGSFANVIKTNSQSQLTVGSQSYTDVINPICADYDLFKNNIYFSKKENSREVYRLDLKSGQTETVLNLQAIASEFSADFRIVCLKVADKKGLIVLNTAEIIIMDLNKNTVKIAQKYPVKDSTLTPEILDIGQNIAILKVYDINYSQNGQTSLVSLRL